MPMRIFSAVFSVLGQARRRGPARHAACINRRAQLQAGRFPPWLGPGASQACRAFLCRSWFV